MTFFKSPRHFGDFDKYIPINIIYIIYKYNNYFLFFSHKQANIQTLKINDGSTKMRLTGHFKSVTGLSFSRGRFELFSGSLDRAILIWDCDRTKEILFSEENRDDHRKRGMNSISSMRSLFDDGHQMNFFYQNKFLEFY